MVVDNRLEKLDCYTEIQLLCTELWLLVFDFGDLE